MSCLFEDWPLTPKRLPVPDPDVVRGRMRRKRGSLWETLGRKMREPRAVDPGFLSCWAQIRQATALGVHWGWANVRSTERLGWSGDGVPHG